MNERKQGEVGPLSRLRRLPRAIWTLGLASLFMV